jgi:hypothetical protein
MSSPHIAGLAALYRAKPGQPGRGEVGVHDDRLRHEERNRRAVTNPFTQGAGHVDPTKFFGRDSSTSTGRATGGPTSRAPYTWNGSDAVTAVDPSNLNLA